MLRRRRTHGRDIALRLDCEGRSNTRRGWRCCNRRRIRSFAAHRWLLDSTRAGHRKSPHSEHLRLAHRSATEPHAQWPAHFPLHTASRTDSLGLHDMSTRTHLARRHKLPIRSQYCARTRLPVRPSQVQYKPASSACPQRHLNRRPVPDTFGTRGSLASECTCHSSAHTPRPRSTHCDSSIRGHIQTDRRTRTARTLHRQDARMCSQLDKGRECCTGNSAEYIFAPRLRSDRLRSNSDRFVERQTPARRPTRRRIPQGSRLQVTETGSDNRKSIVRRRSANLNHLLSGFTMPRIDFA
jgi:hypothetical protein